MSNTTTTSAHWAEHPFALVVPPEKPTETLSQTDEACYKLAVNMALWHNIFFRGLNSLYNYAPHVANGSVRDKHDLTTFGLVWYNMLEEHHDGEEEILFPALETASGNAGLMAANVEQHKVFHSGFANLKTYLDSVIADPAASVFDGTRLQALIDAFAPALLQHLHDEIPTLIDYGHQFPAVDVQKINTEFARAMRSRSPGLVRGFAENLPFMFDGGKWRDHWPRPLKVLASVAKWTFYWPNRGAWRFAPCSFDMELQPEMTIIASQAHSL
ncbi:hypothetical protein BKA62DRAFT_703440 [Auriculariales sp. MPI-PUGE-AT-0066]|nr:hypothetical protein BKA62DRAFT_703440 [Auriculariales sp. MPI-PUGE-AT-0066]